MALLKPPFELNHTRSDLKKGLEAEDGDLRRAALPLYRGDSWRFEFELPGWGYSAARFEIRDKENNGALLLTGSVALTQNGPDVTHASNWTRVVATLDKADTDVAWGEAYYDIDMLDSNSNRQTWFYGVIEAYGQVSE